MYSNDGLDLPRLWSKKLGVLESLAWLFDCVAPLTIIPSRPGVASVSETDFGNGYKCGFSDEKVRFSIGA
jgi:hypothetical protein